MIDDPHKSVNRTPWSNPESRMLRLEQQAADRAFVTASYRAVLLICRFHAVSGPGSYATTKFLEPDEAEKLG